MKKTILKYCIIFISISSFSQEIIESPKYGSYYKKYTEITKIELTGNETILHITSKNFDKDSLLIPKTTYITDENSNTKKFVTGSKNITLGEKTTIPNDGEISYTLIFPPLDKSVNIIDLKIEEAPKGTWRDNLNAV